jgi:hypothetical protein
VDAERERVLPLMMLGAEVEALTLELELAGPTKRVEEGGDAEGVAEAEEAEDA